MRLRTRPLLATAFAGAVAVVPLRGDPGTQAVTHTEWARLLLRGLDVEEALRRTASASQAFALLSWKDSLSLPADAYLHGTGVEPSGEGGIRAREEAEVAYAVSVLRLGEYRLRLRLRGQQPHAVVSEVVPWGAAQPAAVFTLAAPPAPAWVDAGAVHLDPGTYTTAVRLAPGTVLERVELAPPCVSPIEPPGGWRALAVTDRDDLAVTTLQAVDGESALPAAAAPIEVAATEFQPEEALVQAAHDSDGHGVWIRAGAQGRRALALLHVPEDGLYTLSMLGLRGEGQAWLLDGCRKAVLCPDRRQAEGAPAWQPILTARLNAGRHFLVVTLGPQAGLLRLRAERKRDTPDDYVVTLRRLGFEAGGVGAVTRERALEAMRFVASRRERLQESACGDIVPPARGVETALAQPAPLAQPGAVPPSVGQPPGVVEPPPPVPAQPPASPVEPFAGG